MFLRCSSSVFKSHTGQDVERGHSKGQCFTFTETLVKPPKRELLRGLRLLWACSLGSRTYLHVAEVWE